jgi:hypothetical protein
MASFLGGLIPTVNVSSSAITNLAANGLIQNAGGAAINVALGPVLPPQISSVLGITNPGAFNNILGQVITPGLVSSGQVALDNFLTDQIVNSDALGPFGPLASNLASGIVRNLSNDLLGGLFGGNNGMGQGDRWFPGAGNEPAAYYNGNPFAGGPAGADVVISIKTVETLAFADATSTFFDPTAAVSMGAAESLTESISFEQAANLDLSKVLPSGATSSNWGTPSFMNDAAAFKMEGAFSPEFAFSPEGLQAASALNLYKPPAKDSWNFICTPEDISWNSEAQVERIPIFGTNQPPVTVGSRSMRDLTLSNALTEGFSRVKTVEAKVAKLESLMNFTLDTAGGYVKVPVYFVTANDKKYGFGADGKDGGYFVIKSVNVKEEMRDLKGDSTRSMVDVSFTQVPPYQIESGRDIASKAVRGQDALLGEAARKSTDAVNKAIGEGRLNPNGKGSTNTKPTSGSGTPSAAPGTKPAAPGTKPGGTPYQGPTFGNPLAPQPTTR